MEYVFLPPKEIVVINIVTTHWRRPLSHLVLVVACLQSSVFLFCLCVPNPLSKSNPLSQFSEVCVGGYAFLPFSSGILSYTHSGC